MVIDVAVIGAGAAGLCAVRHLASRPSTFSVTAFEQGEKVGGTWVYTENLRQGPTPTGCPSTPACSKI
ncbi:hypothetical protein BaRGS_00004134 [Batillaria attramentaria]|uniref:Flavin-containing monooxygenase n=1 Tax=Batillaria attramentaria TaxID=370345 RepID=A0ABD0M036_9CAEN